MIFMESANWKCGTAVADDALLRGKSVAEKDGNMI